jgi:hypothetical protein
MVINIICIFSAFRRMRIALPDPALIYGQSMGAGGFRGFGCGGCHALSPNNGQRQ